MITYLNRNQINDDRWNAALLKCSNALPYATTAYLDVVSPSWSALVLDNYTAIMPLTRNTKYGFSYLFQPYFAQQLGVFAPAITPQLVNKFLNAIPPRFRFVEINLNSKNSIMQVSGNLKLTERVNYELNLNKPFDELKKNFSDNVLRNYKKALQNELSINEQLSTTDFIAFCTQQAGFLHPKNYLLNLLHKLVITTLGNNTGQLIGVNNKTGNLVAVNLFITGYNRIINLFPVSSKEGSENGAMAFLLFHKIMQHSGTETVFDLEGSMIKGVARFYRSLGAMETKYYRLKINRLPWPIKLIKK